MSKQIEEMAKIICKPTANKGECDKCGFKRSCSKFDDATDIYNAGFRKTNAWIPVTERLPEDDVQVLVVVLGDVELGRYDSKRSLWNTIANVWNDGEVSHWMPLPEPPESEV